MNNLKNLVTLVNIRAKVMALAIDFSIVRMETKFDESVEAGGDVEDSDRNPTPDFHDAGALDSSFDSR